MDDYSKAIEIAKNIYWVGVYVKDDLQIVTHPRTIVFIKHYGIKSLYYNIKKHNYKLCTKNHSLLFLTTPYVHAPCAFATYNQENKILFSSDIFGGLVESWNFWLMVNILKRLNFSMKIICLHKTYYVIH